MNNREMEWLGLAGKTALITGSGSGIGLAIARALLSAGAAVEMVDRTTSAPELVASLMKNTRSRVRAHAADVRDRTGLAAIRDLLDAEGTPLDILIPNAGVNIRKPLIELAPDEVNTIVSTNLAGVIATMQVFEPMLRGRRDASIVCTSSASAEHGMVLRAVYAASKAGVSGLVRSAALEWGPGGIRVNAVAPGIIRTPLTEEYMCKFPEKAAAARVHTPLGRVGTAEEVADVVLFLAGRPSRFMTGQTVFVDGGLTVGNSWW